jgi:hypothetical protein
MERTFGHFYVVLFVVGLLLATAWSLAGQEYQGDQEELDTPAARATIRAAERLERRRSAMDPQARETARAARREEAREFPQAVALHDPVPLPVEIVNPLPLWAGSAVGGSCSGAEPCTLRFDPGPREVVVVTAVWSATRLQCDDAVMATPSNGAVIAPWHTCRRRLLVEGAGAGYAGFVLTGP